VPAKFRSLSRLKPPARILLAFCIGIAALAAIPHSLRAGNDPIAADRPLGPTKVAITIDDIPDHGDLLPDMTRMSLAQSLIGILKANHVTQARGFTNGEFMDEHPEEIAIYKAWLTAGFPLGNHTYDHPNLNQVTVRDYIASIGKQDRLLATLSGFSPLIKDRRVFRYPYLDEGNTLKRRDAVRAYLAQNHYRIAEVTVDYFDWAWTDAYTRCLTQRDDNSMAWLKGHIVDSADRHLRSANAISELLFKRRIPHILLIHDGSFDVLSLDAILKHWREEGVEFISLNEALADPLYQINPNFAYSDGRNFLEQIADGRHVEVGALDDSIYTIDRLNAVCKSRPSK
jgi:peptidoglycan/xylan/chitin deacetylase (PgdA/CDA1 family)